MQTTNYSDFDIEISRSGDKYLARVISSPAGETSVLFPPPLSDLELENFILRLGKSPRNTRRIESEEMQAIQRFGQRMFDTVFSGSVRECFSASMQLVDSEQILGLRVKLRLVDVPELADLPWEYLYHSGQRRFIALSSHTPVVRYLDLPRPVKPITIAPPLRILAIASDPIDYPRLNIQEEKSKLHSALKGMIETGLTELDWLPSANLESLQKYLRRYEVNALHFIGHGGFDSRVQDGVLIFEGEQNRGKIVAAAHLAALLHDHRPLRLVVLNACEGARTSRADPFGGTAASLIQQGIPAVVAMQFEITDKAAIIFAKEFYEAIADGYPVDAAITEARKAIFVSGNEIEWGVPVLYLRSRSAQIFEILRPQSLDEAHSREDTSVASGKTEAMPVTPALIGQLGKFELLEKLGSGSFGNVYRAVDKVRQHEVAIKVLNEGWSSNLEVIQRFQKEFELATSLSHINIVRLFEMGESQGRLYIAMELINGGDLGSILAKGGPLAWNRSLLILEQIGRALDYAHSMGIIHRDIKPSNILFADGARYVLSDFGLGAIYHSGASTAGSSPMVGTPLYLAPEIWMGQPSSHLVDIYALGAIFFEMITGKPLFIADTPAAVMFKHVAERNFPTELPRGIPQGTMEIVSRAVAKKPEERYQSARDFIAALLKAA